MDLILKSRVENFAEKFGYTGSIGHLYERYIASVYLKRELAGDTALVDEVVTGEDEAGIDVAAIVVNGKVMADPLDVQEAVEDRESNTVRAVFMQVKASTSYDAKLISKFLHGVERLTRLVGNNDTEQLESGLVPVGKVLRQVLAVIEKFDTAEIPCELYYITTAPHLAPDLMNDSQVADAFSRIVNHGLYQQGIKPIFHGKREVIARASQESGPQNIKIKFEKRQSIPGMRGVEQAYIGLLPAREFLNIISDGQHMRAGIFDDNVRLYQGEDNAVNMKIAATLRSANRNRFPYLNNGVTLVARKMQNTMDVFTISGYQIVNGCQTSNEIFQWAESAGLLTSDETDILDEVMVPIKLISTSRSDVLEEITIATNDQTQIPATAIHASRSQAKDVEEYFARSGKDGLRYARQGNLDDEWDVPRLRVVGISELNRAVAACVFGESAVSIGSPKSLEKKDSYVWYDNPLEIYYFAAWVVYKVESYFRRPSSPNYLRPAKYHIAMMVSASVVPSIQKVYSNRADKKAMKAAVQEINKNNWTSNLERAISACVKLAEDYFQDALKKKTGLVKDDVRAKKIQSELLQLVADGN